MIKTLKCQKNKKGDYRFGLFGGSVTLHRPDKFKASKVVEPRLKNEPDGMYRKYFVNLYLIVVSICIDFYRKIS